MKDLRKFYYWCAFITILLFSLLQWYFHLNPTTIEEDNKLLLSKIREREIKAVIKKKVSIITKEELYSLFMTKIVSLLIMNGKKKQV